MADELKVETTPRDPRFPNTNQSQHCWTRYNEWVLCLKRTEGDSAGCFKTRKFALSICPNEWIEKWDEEREAGNFPGLKY
mmetsp:Transcript_6793/g.8576  ORF Transcript_6793/g.8576 Transcript_6793/m.8576 type:complete len:80 (+) Transcript_6793:198-437(+)|eukprot:CAMPEP_0204831364 /NCGR_PEP_ID=MMETSP1346-20131115/10510_1 /ASSEMBLY_ACC=CAM_ASM_000771 /TAXON_ID=215587 /ORGANISM="Aplanochytrium stocchinoi, Strain GSBS06" /LENGTH=79 /DNA_ID=CAMNT_0051962373 /DNA_START=264 /DNA_END=503 /DNA_ORIENTATION=-